MATITLQDLYNKIEDIIKVSPAATDATKLQGKRHKELLKLFADAIFQQTQALADLPYDWTIPSDRFSGYNNSSTTFLPGFYQFMHPSKPPVANLTASNPIREIGSSNVVTLSYGFAPGTSPITSVKIGNTSIALSPPTGTRMENTAINTDTSFTMVVADVAGLQTVTTAQVKYLSRFFIFTSNQRFENLSDDDLSQFIRTQNGVLANTRNQSAQINPQNEYYHIAYVNSLGTNPTITANGIQDTSARIRPFNYINSQNVTQQFTLFSGENLLTGVYNLAIS